MTRSARLLSPALLALVLLAPGILGAGASGGPWGVWVHDTVDNTVFTIHPSIAITSTGEVWIAYQSDGAEIVLASEASGWQPHRFGMWTGILPQLAFDSQDRPHIVFKSAKKWGSDDAKILHAWQDGQSWKFEVVDDEQHVSPSTAFFIDGQDGLHVSYANAAGTAFKYAYKGNSGWQVETAAPTVSKSWVDLAVDVSGRVHLGYSSGVNPTWGGLKYSIREVDGTWTHELVDFMGGTGVSMAIDSQGRPHMSYRGEGETLAYAHHNGTGWSYEVIDRDRPTGWGTSIAVDSHDRPHIAYEQVLNRANPKDPLRGHVKYAVKFDTMGWSVETAAPIGGTEFPDLAIGPDDMPRIAYVHVRDQALPLEGGFNIKYTRPAAAVAHDQLRTAGIEAPPLPGFA